MSKSLKMELLCVCRTLKACRGWRNRRRKGRRRGWMGSWAEALDASLCAGGTLRWGTMGHQVKG